MWILFTLLVTGNYIKDAKELSEYESKDFIDDIKDSSDVTLAANDDKEVFED